jgi:hypothetical protein
VIPEEIPAGCRDRHHRWTVSPPVVGTKCSRCPATYGGPGHKRRRSNGSNGSNGTAAAAARSMPKLTEADIAEIFPSPNAAPTAAELEQLESLADAGALPDADTSSPPAAPAPGQPLPIPSWCPFVAKRFAALFVIADRWIIERGGKLKANEPNESTVEEFADGCAEQLAIWFPDAELSPWKKILVAGIGIHGEQRIGAKRVTAGAPAAAAATHAKPAGTSTESREPALPITPPVPAGAFPPGMFGA